MASRLPSIALANGLNANMLRKWVIDAEQREAQGMPSGSAPVVVSPTRDVPGFVPLQLPAPQEPADIRIELQRGAIRVTLTWPVNAAADCATWLREILR